MDVPLCFVIMENQAFLISLRSKLQTHVSQYVPDCILCSLRSCIEDCSCYFFQPIIIHTPPSQAELIYVVLQCIRDLGCLCHCRKQISATLSRRKINCPSVTIFLNGDSHMDRPSHFWEPAFLVPWGGRWEERFLGWLLFLYFDREFIFRRERHKKKSLREP